MSRRSTACRRSSSSTRSQPPWPFVLRPVQCGAGVPQQGVRGAGTGGLALTRDRDPDGRRRHDQAPLEVHRLAQGLQDALRDEHRFALVPDVVAHDGELVAGEAGGGVPAAQGQLQPGGHLDEDDVPEVGAHAVVDHAEPVEVQAQDGDPAAGAARPLERPGDAVEPEGAVGQAGERVVQRLVLQHLQRQPRLGEVGDLHQGVPGASAVIRTATRRDRCPHRLAARPLVAPLEVEPLTARRPRGVRAAPSRGSRRGRRGR